MTNVYIYRPILEFTTIEELYGQARCLRYSKSSQIVTQQTRLAIIGSVEQLGQSVIDKVSHYFYRSWKQEEEYTIQLKEGAKPFSLSTPRRVPLPLLKPVKEELDRMF